MNTKALSQILGVLVLTGALLAWLSVGKYNGMVEYEEQVNEKWSQVRTQYQRRADLIPNIVNSVKGYAEYEESTFGAITATRATVGQIQAPDINDKEAMDKWLKAQSQFRGAISRLLVVSERYPNLKADKTFMSLISELSTTENMIAEARQEYNATAREMNTHIRKFPQSVVALLTGFKKAVYFEGDEGIENAPKVEF